MEKKIKILVVEDDADYRNALSDGFSKSNYEVHQADDGEEAIELVMDERPNLILLDLLLPKIDGYKVLERIRHYPQPEISEIKVVVLSNLWSDKDILRAQSLKIDEYFVKADTNLEQVFKRVNEILLGPPL